MKNKSIAERFREEVLNEYILNNTFQDPVKMEAFFLALKWLKEQPENDLEKIKQDAIIKHEAHRKSLMISTPANPFNRDIPCWMQLPQPPKKQE